MAEHLVGELAERLCFGRAGSGGFGGVHRSSGHSWGSDGVQRWGSDGLQRWGSDEVQRWGQ